MELLADPDPWKRFAAETTVTTKRTRREDAAFYRQFEPSLMEAVSSDHIGPEEPSEYPEEEPPDVEPGALLPEASAEELATYEEPSAPDERLEGVSAQGPTPATIPDEEAVFAVPETPSSTVVTVPGMSALTTPDIPSPFALPESPSLTAAAEPGFAPPCVGDQGEGAALYSAPEAPSTTMVGPFPDEPSAYTPPEYPSRTMIRSDGTVVMAEEESEYPTPEVPSQTLVLDARRDPCYVETFVDFGGEAESAWRESIWREEQEKRAPPEEEGEFRGWLDVKLDRQGRGVPITAPDEVAPDNMFFDFPEAEEKLARDAIWQEEQAKVNREVVTPAFYGWRDWEVCEAPAAEPEPEVEPTEPELFEDFTEDKERQRREEIWRREQMEPCPETEDLPQPRPPSKRVTVDLEKTREVCYEDTFMDFPDDEERRRRQEIWDEEQKKTLKEVVWQKLPCGEKPQEPPEPDVFPMEFRDFEDNREREERDAVWQREQEKVLPVSGDEVYQGWRAREGMFSDLDGLDEEQIYTRKRLWDKEQTKRVEESTEPTFEGWETGVDHTVQEMFEDFPDNQERAERDAVWDAEQKKIHREEREEYEGWLEEREEGKDLGVVVSSVEMFHDFDDQREKCACSRVWEEEQGKVFVETGERFEGWNEWEPCTRVAEGEQVVETFEEQGPYVTDMFEDFPEPEEKQARDAIWQEAQGQKVQPEPSESVFDGWQEKKDELSTEGAMFWDFPDREESCRRQKIWNEEQEKIVPAVEFDECGNRVPVFHGWVPDRIPCEGKQFVPPPPPQPLDELAADYETESLLAEEREAEAEKWHEFQMEITAPPGKAPRASEVPEEVGSKDSVLPYPPEDTIPEPSISRDSVVPYQPPDTTLEPLRSKSRDSIVPYPEADEEAQPGSFDGWMEWDKHLPPKPEEPVLPEHLETFEDFPEEEREHRASVWSEEQATMAAAPAEPRFRGWLEGKPNPVLPEDPTKYPVEDKESLTGGLFASMYGPVGTTHEIPDASLIRVTSRDSLHPYPPPDEADGEQAAPAEPATAEGDEEAAYPAADDAGGEEKDAAETGDGEPAGPEAGEAAAEGEEAAGGEAETTEDAAEETKEEQQPAAEDETPPADEGAGAEEEQTEQPEQQPEGGETAAAAEAEPEADAAAEPEAEAADETKAEEPTEEATPQPEGTTEEAPAAAEETEPEEAQQGEAAEPAAEAEAAGGADEEQPPAAGEEEAGDANNSNANQPATASSSSKPGSPNPSADKSPDGGAEK